MKQIIITTIMIFAGVLCLNAQNLHNDSIENKKEDNIVKTHDITGYVIDKKEQPIIGAFVTVEGTSISTVTDIEGKFLLTNVPFDAQHIIVESTGMQTQILDIHTPIAINQRRKKLSFVVSAGAIMSRYTYYGGSFKAGYEIGAGIEIRFSRHWAFQPMIQLANRGSVYKKDNYKEIWNPVMLDFPMYFVNRQKLAYKTNLVISAGPVLSCGLFGDVTVENNGEKTKYELYTKEYNDSYGYGQSTILYPFNFGVAYSLGVEYKQLLIGIWGKNMVLPNSYYGMDLDPAEHNWSLTFGAAYRF